MRETEKGEACTFTAVITPDDSKRVTFNVSFDYTNFFGSAAEEATVWYGVSENGEYTVTNIHHETRFEKFLSDLTGGLL